MSDPTTSATPDDQLPPADGDAPTVDNTAELAACAPDEGVQNTDAVARAQATPPDAPGQVGAWTSAYQQWIDAGRPFTIAWPIADLVATLRSHGYTVYTLGDQSHLTAPIPEDHTPYSATGWPNPTPRWWVTACDIMPNSSLPSLAELGAQLAADKRAGIPGASVIKYMNWSPAGEGCRHESWEPGDYVTGSSDVGHIHLSIRSDMIRSRVSQGYDPVARLHGGGVVPVVYHPPAGAPAFPGRDLTYPNSPMMQGTDVRTVQQRLYDRGWRNLGNSGPARNGVDGWYGNISRNAVVAFQNDSTRAGYPLAADGIVGPKTWAMLWTRPVS